MIDKATVDRILDAADIVEVVSDFVSLKRRGANYVGLCPFHNEKTPSFSVSKSKGICHCFSCGKGGSPVNFIMEHEQMSYYEALKYLAQKYHIEIHERELTDKERAEQSERESMLIINETANKIFEDNLFNTPDGKEIGLPYFNERGFSPAIIKKFRLGYSLDNRSALYKSLSSKGYNPRLIFETGLCVDDKHGGGFDRFKGRAMFPVINVAGKIIAFGGRTLKHEPAKYINSPESTIYKKSNELYGLFQAKHSIVKNDKCYLVEGYADVISMHQSGFENTVASSGTSLTEGQIRLIHRFTNNVTVLYDGDAAGIKASLRSIDLLLAEGLNIKVLLLPDGDDPDSFSRKHSTSEIETYIKENETDFIQFKMHILLEGTKDDPIKKSAVIQDVIKSIAVIPFPITRSIYTKECSRRLEIDEQILLNEIEKIIAQNKRKDLERKQKEKNLAQIDNAQTINNEISEIQISEDDKSRSKVGIPNSNSSYEDILFPYEKTIIKYIIKYGLSDFCEASDENGDIIQLSVLNYISNEFNTDNIQFTNSTFALIFKEAVSISAEFSEAYNAFIPKLNETADKMYQQGIDEIKQSQKGIEDIETREKLLKERIDNEKARQLTEFKINYLEKKLCSSPNDLIRNTASDLISEKHHLSKIHTRFSPVKSEYERITKLIPEAIYNLKSAIILCQIKDIQRNLPSIIDTQEAQDALVRLQELFDLRAQLAKCLGDRVVNPKI